ncbi:rod shape-determining protein MreC [Methylotenera sp. L2L1]|uniref:rod shape-determining protein MreC n=1 Tax=Methylotenera sp. L2L1 TaxID=1502770 RepID=UPI00056658A3|nr:rod shape-determining protein MreC [Methylotenera sp. L2L1]
MAGYHQNLDQQQAPAFFARGPSPLARLAFFSALSLALMATDSRLQYLGTVREHLMVVLQPLQLIANAPSMLYDSTNEYFSTHHRLLDENQLLRKQALVQAISLQKMKTLELENTNLRQLLQANQSLEEFSQLGEILHVGRDPFTKKIIVNRGSAHQVVNGAAVVDAKGVIGQVTRTYPASSEVTLITDQSLTIPIQVERNGLRAIAFGHGRDNTLDLPFLPANVDIKPGDKLITSGIDGIYPKGLAVATVTEIQTSQDSPFARIVCAPTGGIENHKQVLLVSISPSESITPPNTTKQPIVNTDANHATLEKSKPSALKELDQHKKITNEAPAVAVDANTQNKPHAQD